jgi:hypothetical protein
MTRFYRVSRRRRKELRQEAEDNFRFYSGSCSHGTPPFDECEKCKEEKLADEVKDDDSYWKRVDDELERWKDEQ